jgi:hypothetical protein
MERDRSLFQSFWSDRHRPTPSRVIPVEHSPQKLCSTFLLAAEIVPGGMIP